MRRRAMVGVGVAFLLAALLGCASDVATSGELEARVSQLEAEVGQLTDMLAALEVSAETAAMEAVASQMRAGELARRVAEAGFERNGGREAGLAGFEEALQVCLREIDQRPDQSYLVEDVVFLADFASMQPSSPTGPAWQFTVQSSAGRFIVTVDARSGELVFTNKVQ